MVSVVASPRVVLPLTDTLLLNIWSPVKVWPASVRAIVAVVVGNVIVVASVPARVRVLFAVSVLLFAIVSVALVAGAVIVSLLMLVAVATPSVGVTSVGEVAKTNDPEPVSSVTAAARLAEEGVPSHVATPVPSEVMPVPPFEGANVPPSVTAPVVAVFGVSPVVPALKDATVPAVVASVPVVGRVTLVVPVVVRVRE